MNDTPLTVEVEKLKNKLNIDDYICYQDEGDICINHVLSLEITEMAIQKGLNQGFKKAGNIDEDMVEVLEALVEADPKALNGLIGNSDAHALIDNSSLSPEWQKLNAEKEELEKMLENNQSLPKEKREEVEKNLIILKEGLGNLKTKELENGASIKFDQKILQENPELLLKLVKAIKPKDDIKIIEVDKDQKMVTLKNKIITTFLKSKSKENIDELKKKITRRDFRVLCYGIALEPENLLTPESIDFFMKTLDSKK
jgi:hypothetical protein